MTAGHGEPSPTVLALDASTGAASVAVLRGRDVLAERHATMRGADEEQLMPAVDAALRSVGVGVRALDAIVCGGGPGSFTSLRIAGAIAKGIATVTGVPLLAAPSLALAAVGAQQGAGRWLVSLDAMRTERYAALVALEGDGGDARVVGYEYLGVRAAGELPAIAAAHGARGIIDADRQPPAARGVSAFGLSLRGGAVDAAGALTLAPVDLATWEPDYGRKAEAQVKWEALHGVLLPVASGMPA